MPHLPKHRRPGAGNRHETRERQAARERLPAPVLNRRAEHATRYFRSGRYFTVGHQWYATTREGGEIGPFADRDEAETVLARHVAGALMAAQPDGVAALEECAGREATPFEVLVREILYAHEQRRLRSENSAYVWVRQRLTDLQRHPEHSSRDHLHRQVLENLLVELDSRVTR